jgi:hypothetical protein
MCRGGGPGTTLGRASTGVRRCELPGHQPRTTACPTQRSAALRHRSLELSWQRSVDSVAVGKFQEAPDENLGDDVDKRYRPLRNAELPAKRQCTRNERSIAAARPFAPMRRAVGCIGCQCGVRGEAPECCLQSITGPGLSHAQWTPSFQALLKTPSEACCFGAAWNLLPTPVPTTA